MYIKVFQLVTCFFLITSVTFAQQKSKVDLHSPSATIYSHLYYLQPDSKNLQKAATTIYNLPKKEAEQKAIRILKVLDNKGLKVDIKNLPTNPNYKDSVGSLAGTYSYVLFPNKLPEIYVEKIGDNWYYSKETVEKIDAIYHKLFPWGTEFLINVIPKNMHARYLNIEVWQFLGFVILIIFGIVLFYFLKKIVFTILNKTKKFLIKEKHEYITDATRKLSQPISLLIVFFLIKKNLPILQLHIDISSLLFMSIEIANTVFWIYVFLKLVNVVMTIFEVISEKTESKLDDQLAPILRTLLTGIVIFIGALKMLTVLGVNTTAVIAGASVGGLAVALASQDTVKNLLGTFMLFLDKPFQIGDWIQAGEVVGTVEKVGFRSSRIRAADSSVFQIPNSRLSEMVVKNTGLLLHRRYKTELGIRYDTPPELIEAFTQGLRKIIENHPDTRSDAYNVEFTGFGDSALLILVNLYFTSTQWGNEQSSKHSLHLAIIKLAAALGVDFAFPSSTLMIENFPEKKAFDMNYNKVNDINLDKILKDINNSF